MARSAAVMKADDVRIIARNTLKIVTGGEKTDSTSEICTFATGIQLIGNNDDRDMQPIPKGINLEQALQAILERIQALIGTVATLTKIQKNSSQTNPHLCLLHTLLFF